MPITFNCEHCGKTVKAPDGKGGKWGACPHCKGRCYVPNITDDEDEELHLAPVDEEEEKKSEELLEEEKRIREEILRQSKEPPEE